MRARSLRLQSSMAAIAAVLAAAPAAAQGLFTDEIIVTAQKREQNVQDVPINITAYSGDFLNTIGVQQFDELADFVPGLQIQEQSANNPGFVIRGITSDDGGANIEPRVSVYRDGVSISKSRGSFVELFDVERIEVAKGPQSTLYGRGALIGAINVIQNKPTEEFEAGIAGEVGNLGYDMVEGYVSGPLVGDKLSGRLAFRHKTRDGYIDNALGGADFNGVEVGAIRGILRYTPRDNFTADLILNYQKDTPSGTSFKSGTFQPDGGDLEPQSAAALNTFGNFEGGRDLGLERDLWSATLLVDAGLSDAFSVSSLTAFRRFDSHEIFDPDGTALPIFVFAEDATGDQFSQELRLNFDNGGQITWFAGVSYFYEDGQQRVPLQYDERGVQALVAGLFTPPNLPPIESLPSIDLIAAFGGNIVPLKPIHFEEFSNFGETKSFDVYGDVTYKPTDRVELIAGLRYTQDDKTTGVQGLVPSPSVLTGGGLNINPTLNDAIIEQGDTFEGFTWRLVAKYDISDTWNVYASYARGRRPEVIDASFEETSSTGAAFETIDAEEVDSYEIGVKGSLLDGSIILDGSAFYYEYENFQSSILDDTGTPTAINAGNATSYGVEGQAVYEPNDFATFFATYAWNRGRFDDAVDGEPQQFGDNQFRLSPDHAFSLGAQFSYPVANGAVRFTPTYAWKSEVFFDDDNDLTDGIQDEKQDAYGLLNLRLDYTAPENRYTFGVFMNNALDKEYIVDAGNTGDTFGIPTFIAGAPQTYGVRVSANF